MSQKVTVFVTPQRINQRPSPSHTDHNVTLQYNNGTDHTVTLLYSGGHGIVTFQQFPFVLVL